MTDYDDHHVQAALRNEEEIIACQKPIGGLELALGRALVECKRYKYYKVNGYETLRAYLTYLDIPLDRDYRAIRIWEFYVEKLNMPPSELIKLSATKLDILRRVVNERNWSEWQAKMNLSYGDLIEEIAEAQGRKTDKERLMKKGIGGYYRLVKMPGYEPPPEKGERVKGKIWRDGEEIVVNI